MPSVDELVRSGKLRPDDSVRPQAASFLRKAEASLAVAERELPHDPSWAYTAAYTACFQATTGLMHAMGYRVGSHLDGHQCRWTSPAPSFLPPATST